jgi:hypothetical protein
MSVSELDPDHFHSRDKAYIDEGIPSLEEITFCDYAGRLSQLHLQVYGN